MKTFLGSRGGIISILGLIALVVAALSSIQTRNINYGTNIIIDLYLVAYGIYLYFGRKGMNIAARDALFKIISGLIGFLLSAPFFILDYSSGAMYVFDALTSILFIVLAIWGTIQYFSLRRKKQSEA